MQFDVDDVLDDVSVAPTLARHEVVDGDVRRQSDALVERVLEVLLGVVETADLAFERGSRALQQVLQHADLIDAVRQTTVRVQLSANASTPPLSNAPVCLAVFFFFFNVFSCIRVLVLDLLVVRAASIGGCLCLSGSLPLLSCMLVLICFEANKYDDDDDGCPATAVRQP